MLNITVVGDKELVARLDAMPAKVQQALYRKVSALALKLEAKVKQKLTNDVLHVRSGDLRRSIHSDVTADAQQVTGRVASAGDVKYAAIQEFGGIVKNPGGTPYMINGKTGLAFFISKSDAIARYLPVTKAHQIPIPERSYLRSSLTDMRDEIVDGLKEAVAEGVAE